MKFRDAILIGLSSREAVTARSLHRHIRMGTQGSVKGILEALVAEGRVDLLHQGSAQGPGRIGNDPSVYRLRGWELQ